jgi:hypothetical protein
MKPRLPMAQPVIEAGVKNKVESETGQQDESGALKEYRI